MIKIYIIILVLLFFCNTNAKVVDYSFNAAGGTFAWSDPLLWVCIPEYYLLLIVSFSFRHLLHTCTMKTLLEHTRTTHTCTPPAYTCIHLRTTAHTCTHTSAHTLLAHTSHNLHKHTHSTLHFRKLSVATRALSLSSFNIIVGWWCARQWR